MSLSAAARSAAALVKDKLTPNCHFVVSAESEKVNCSIYWKELANDIDMIEALRDLSAKGCSTYTSSCQIDNAKLNDYKMLSGNGNILGNMGKYGVEEWRLVIKSFAMRLSCLLSLDEVISYDDYKKRVSPATIFYNQQQWFEKGKTFILSAIPEFLLDYFGLSFWKRYIMVKKINKKFCKGQIKKGR